MTHHIHRSFGQFLLICALTLASVACACPTQAPSFATAQDTLATWQNALCRDDQEGEYACFSQDLKRGMGGFQGYHAARAIAIQDNPAFAWLAGHLDLGSAEISQEEESAMGVQTLTLEIFGNPMVIDFRRETLVTIRYAEGPPTVGRTNSPLPELLGSDGATWWVRTKLALPLESQMSQIQKVEISSDWRIDSFHLPGLSSPSHDW